MFVNDLQYWKHFEKEFAKTLIDNKDFISIEIPDKKFIDYDIKLTTKSGSTTYEVKSDTMAHKTGNVVFETRYKWIASWIYASKADYIVYFVKWKCYIQSKWELILRLMNVEKRVTKWWDWWNSELLVVSCNELEKLFDIYPLTYNYEQNGETKQGNNWDTTTVPTEVWL